MAARPSFVSKSATTALTSSLDPASAFAAARAELLANASLRAPHRPLGSAAETAIPANIVLSRILVHSSGLKFCLFAIPTSTRYEDSHKLALHSASSVERGVCNSNLTFSPH